MVLIKILEPYKNRVKGFTVLRMRYNLSCCKLDQYAISEFHREDAIKVLTKEGIKFEVIEWKGKHTLKKIWKNSIDF